MLSEVTHSFRNLYHCFQSPQSPLMHYHAPILVLFYFVFPYTSSYYYGLFIVTSANIITFGANHRNFKSRDELFRVPLTWTRVRNFCSTGNNRSSGYDAVNTVIEHMTFVRCKNRWNRCNRLASSGYSRRPPARRYSFPNFLDNKDYKKFIYKRSPTDYPTDSWYANKLKHFSITQQMTLLGRNGSHTWL